MQACACRAVTVEAGAAVASGRGAVRLPVASDGMHEPAMTCSLGQFPEQEHCACPTVPVPAAAEDIGAWLPCPPGVPWAADSDREALVMDVAACEV